MRLPVIAVALLAASMWGADDPRASFDPYKHVIWMPVRIDGGPLLNFAFDSAAVRTAIDWDRAVQLKLPFTPLGERMNAGSGDGAARLGETGALRLTIPGATLNLPKAVVVPLGGVSESYGRAMEGLVGAELLARYVVELDWEARRMLLHDPEGFRYSGEGEAVPLIVAGGVPLVRMTVTVPGARPAEGIFLVDCPHPGTIIMNKPFVEERGLLEAARRTLPRLVAQHAEGVGGKSEVWRGRIASLQLGPFTLREPVVGFSQARAGSLARAEFAGILGAEILRRFRVILDYSRERMILEPKPSLTEPYRFDASGIQLRAGGAGFREYLVTGVVEESPAAKAKVQAGDRLVEIGGTPAKEMSLGEVLDRLARDGEALPLKFRRGGETVALSLRLRQLI